MSADHSDLLQPLGKLCLRHEDALHVKAPESQVLICLAMGQYTCPGRLSIRSSSVPCRY